VIRRETPSKVLERSKEKVGRPEGPTDPEERNDSAKLAENRTHTGEKKQKWPWVPETSGKWWIEALASRALREENAEPQ